MWRVGNIKVIPVIVRALGCTLKKLKNCTGDLGVIRTGLVQKIAQLETAAMLKKVLGSR